MYAKDKITKSIRTGATEIQSPLCECLIPNRKTNMTQKERILIILQSHENGVHSFTLIRDQWILRASERIRELKAEGWNITSKPEKMGKSYGVRYRLEV